MMDAAELLEQVRASSGLTQEELARRAGTSRPTLSAYEHGRKSPTVATFARLLSGAGWELAALPQVSFTQQPSPRGRPAWVPDRLPRLDVARALAVVELPLHLNWSAPGRAFDLRSRADRARVFALPASRCFLLAGGAALLAQHLTARPTEDLDFFTAPERGHVPAARDALE